MAKEILGGAEVHALVGEVEAARVAQHVGVHMSQTARQPS